jgi:hypothetical protein
MYACVCYWVVLLMYNTQVEVYVKRARRAKVQGTIEVLAYPQVH